MDGVTILKGKKDGPTAVIMGGSHGNEKVGPRALDVLERELSIDAGTVYLIRANLSALRQNKRFIESDMNRCFSLLNKGQTEEEKRTLELMKILDTADALLDLHSFNDDAGEPFAITDRPSMSLARIFDVPTLSLGWDAIHKGSSDEYMHSRGKAAVSVECGPTVRFEAYTPFAIDCSYRFLAHLSMLSYTFAEPENQKIVSITRSIKRVSPAFAFARKFDNFESLEAGKVFATDGDIEYTAQAGEVIMFCRPNAPIGGEVAIVGRLDD